MKKTRSAVEQVKSEKSDRIYREYEAIHGAMRLSCILIPLFQHYSDSVEMDFVEVVVYVFTSWEHNGVNDYT